MNEKLLREYVKEILAESTEDQEECGEYGCTYGQLDAVEGFKDADIHSAAVIKSYARLSNNKDIGDWGEEQAMKIVKRYGHTDAVNTNDVYGDKTFPFADIITKQITKENIESIIFYDVKTSAAKGKSAAYYSHIEESIKKLINYKSDDLDMPKIINAKYNETKKTVSINIGLITFDYADGYGGNLITRVYDHVKVPLKITRDGDKLTISSGKKLPYNLKTKDISSVYTKFNRSEVKADGRKKFLNKISNLKVKVGLLNDDAIDSIQGLIDCEYDVKDSPVSCSLKTSDDWELN
jgi:hypothetical protein